MMGLQQNIGDQKKKKKSVNLKIGQQKLLSPNNRDNILKNKNKQSVRYLWDKNRISNISVLEEKEKRTELKESPNILTEKLPQVSERHKPTDFKR